MKYIQEGCQIISGKLEEKIGNKAGEAIFRVNINQIEEERKISRYNDEQT